MSQVSENNQPFVVLFFFINDNIYYIKYNYPFSSFLQKEMALLTIKIHEHYNVIQNEINFFKSANGQNVKIVRY